MQPFDGLFGCLRFVSLIPQVNDSHSWYHLAALILHIQLTIGRMLLLFITG